MAEESKQRGRWRIHKTRNFTQTVEVPEEAAMSKSVFLSHMEEIFQGPNHKVSYIRSKNKNGRQIIYYRLNFNGDAFECDLLHDEIVWAITSHFMQLDRTVPRFTNNHRYRRELCTIVN